ncbi:amidinotransferase [Micromonospora rosaria]|uniref:Amidinotransferase n=1 Tax=Micromonospora rosaria TaxID=47874 RepID=A0A136PVD7_9ACTN|nr:dimethylargininase [Micromonospora rosaria]KXK62438.1 amidinotransferase [Micromonospora rosaria]
MAHPSPAAGTGPHRVARPRHYLMCRPGHFDVSYSINPWMHPEKPTATAVAVAQWENLRQIFLDLGHRVDELDPVPGLPDMVYTANGALLHDGTVVVARFRHAQRAAESDAYLRWFAARGYPVVHQADRINEGEGDFLLVGRRILAGFGFRTDPLAHHETQEILGLPVIGLHLTDPRYYHLDTALAVLDDDEIMYYPAAFSPGSQAVLRELYPDAVIATSADAEIFGLNAVSDGRHVVLPAAAVDLAAQLRKRGFVTIGVDMSELLKGGGGAKCCTLELRYSSTACASPPAPER